jgi:predicted DNA-binding transcriptional regulator AlpA
MKHRLMIVCWKQLVALGWPYSRTETWRRINGGKFPKPIKLGSHRNSHPVWRMIDIRAYFEQFGLVLPDTDAS